eukprot:729150_1
MSAFVPSPLTDTSRNLSLMRQRFDLESSSSFIHRHKDIMKRIDAKLQSCSITGHNFWSNVKLRINAIQRNGETLSIQTFPELFNQNCIGLPTYGRTNFGVYTEILRGSIDEWIRLQESHFDCPPTYLKLMKQEPIHLTVWWEFWTNKHKNKDSSQVPLDNKPYSGRKRKRHHVIQVSGAPLSPPNPPRKRVKRGIFPNPNPNQVNFGGFRSNFKQPSPQTEVKRSMFVRGTSAEHRPPFFQSNFNSNTQTKVQNVKRSVFGATRPMAFNHALHLPPITPMGPTKSAWQLRQEKRNKFCKEPVIQLESKKRSSRPKAAKQTQSRKTDKVKDKFHSLKNTVDKLKSNELSLNEVGNRHATMIAVGIMGSNKFTMELTSKNCSNVVKSVFKKDNKIFLGSAQNLGELNKSGKFYSVGERLSEIVKPLLSSKVNVYLEIEKKITELATVAFMEE